tara:strand:- start:327 stop:893 length:567 start_codon:yes stop_codon:yes gene_type:complete
MREYKSKFHTVRVSPVCAGGSVDDGDIIFSPVEIPNACPKNGTSMLRQIKVYNTNDVDADIELLFFSNKAKSEATGSAAAKFTAAGGNDTDSSVESANPLGTILVDVSGGPGRTAVSSQDGVFYETLDYTNNRLHIVRGLNFFVNPGNLTTNAEECESLPSSIYVMGIATATKTYTLTGLTFEFTFEF